MRHRISAGLRSTTIAAGAFAILGGMTAFLSGCALPIQAEMDRASDVAHYAVHFDHVVGPENNLLDRALAECSEKTVKAEQICVRQGIDGSSTSPRALAALVPRCKAGQVCRYDHTTHDRIGPVEATATDHAKHWRVELDFRHPAADSVHVPVTVIDLDDFDSAAAG